MTRTTSALLAGVVGALFGAGLLISGMTQPAKVVGFLDPTHGWDPSLAFVMAGAAGVYAILFRAIRKRGRPWLDVKFHLPARRDLDMPLILGAGIFGVGWGLGGLCPGPAIVAAASGTISGIAFVVAMLAGMYAQHRTTRA
ncbi:MAG TPA: DUF6691 family protein [Kofleriaceae bacterium]